MVKLYVSNSDCQYNNGKEDLFPLSTRFNEFVLFNQPYFLISHLLFGFGKTYIQTIFIYLDRIKYYDNTPEYVYNKYRRFN